METGKQHYSSNRIIREITPLSERDSLYIVKRYKDECNYPIHTHDIYELNFIQWGSGVKRIVGDSVETITDWELVLITKSNLEHTWDGVPNEGQKMKEITLQFAPDFFSETMLQRNQMISIGEMFERGKHGLLFSQEVIREVAPELNLLVEQTGSFEQILHFIHILHTLSLDTQARELSSKVFAKEIDRFDSRRVKKVDEYMTAHYQENIRLSELAELVHMSEVGFSRFFHLRTGLTVSEYLIKIRIGQAARLLVDTTNTVREIAYACGFNNISNFNRLFLKFKQLTPNEFRQTYRKTKTII